MPDSPDTSAAAIVRDHAFEPRTEFDRETAFYIGAGMYTREPETLPPNEYLCGYRSHLDGRLCRLAEAAHTR
jgi:hypothetical protein